jgi:predicted alpha/beta-hydrolase family hydrolase
MQEFDDDSLDPKVKGWLHASGATTGNGIVLAHGAGSNANAPLLIALAETFSTAGFTVLRCDLPYRQTRTFGPPGPGDAARDRAGLKNAITAMKKLVTGEIFLGGHSYGGRQASMLCAESVEGDLAAAAGLLLLSYPLHPPRKPEQQRTQHLPDLLTPTLFVHGTRDPFGTIAEIEQVLKMIPAKTKLLTIAGAGHDLGFKAKAKADQLTQRIVSEVASFNALSS